ncbi:restriction endonuclease [Halomicrobium sp. IBSBa]|uniref:restriction endonuclease n=1 Tax=Halomicrobium sp. IBSBa TaxID=2778916 RepID=UPI001ABF0CEC|nr:restriction endonuclease [Halomicrobium sp. IBSBa]MBO4249526.1 restriction endonuclease [Halomicrobium sp. IBSBa]
MADYGREYVVNKTYRSSSDATKDQFQKWLNGPIDNGIRNSGGIRSITNPDTGKREFLVFVSDSGASQTQNPWEDVINMEEGIVRYWGDAKARHTPHPETATGNGWVKDDYCRTYAQNDRPNAPPVLLFEKPESGKVTFRGVCIITDLRIERHRDNGETVVNYLFELAILNANSIDLEWVHRKARTGVDVGGPDAWNRWVREGRIQRYSIYKDSIRSKEGQDPEGREADLLEDIRERLDDPNKGEKLEVLIQFLMEGLKNFSNVELTPESGDRGVDLTGQVDLFSDRPLRGVDTKIEFKAQVKNRGSSISGKELSRLASRVDDGEIGLFFTTSHYTRSAQRENLSTYPVRLFSGGDLVELLFQTDLADNGKLTDEVVEDIHEEVG